MQCGQRMICSHDCAKKKQKTHRCACESHALIHLQLCKHPGLITANAAADALAAVEARNASARERHAAECAERAAAVAAADAAAAAWAAERDRLQDAHARAVAAATAAHERDCRAASVAWNAKKRALEVEHTAMVDAERARHEAAVEVTRAENAQRRERHRAAVAVRCARPCVVFNEELVLMLCLPHVDSTATSFGCFCLRRL